MPVPGNASFITVAPDGTITYDFTGHISARGLDLLAGTTSSPPEDRKVRWLRESDGAVVAAISSFDSGAFSGATVDLTDPSNTSFSAELGFQVDKGASLSSLEARAYRSAAPFLQARKIIDSSGNSDFVQRSRVRLQRPYFGQGAGSSGTFTVPYDNAFMMIITQGTAYAPAIGFSSIRNDITSVGFIGDNVLYQNVANQHATYNMLVYPTTGLAAGTYTLTNAASANCTRDANDANAALVLCLDTI